MCELRVDTCVLNFNELSAASNEEATTVSERKAHEFRGTYKYANEFGTEENELVYCQGSGIALRRKCVNKQIEDGVRLINRMSFKLMILC